MRLDLAFGLHHEAQADRIPDPGRYGAHHIGARVPQGIQDARLRTQFVQALRAPGQVVFFFLAGFFELRAQLRRVGETGLRIVQRLGAHFADMIHTHQARAVTAIGIGQFAVHGVRGRVRARHGGHAADDAQGLVDADNQVVQGADETIRGHGWLGNLVAEAFIICLSSRDPLDQRAFGLDARDVLGHTQVQFEQVWHRHDRHAGTVPGKRVQKTA